MISAQDDITVIKGRNWSRTYTFQDSDGNAIDLSLYTFQGQARESRDPTSTLITAISFDITNAATGIIIASIDDSGSSISAASGFKGYFDIVAIDAASEPWTYIHGYATFLDVPTVVT
jgi:hypothetical protein